MSAVLDAFNILNTNTANIGAQSGTSGRPTVTLDEGSRVQVQGFLRPTSIIPPRVVRFAIKVGF